MLDLFNYLPKIFNPAEDNQTRLPVNHLTQKRPDRFKASRKLCLFNLRILKSFYPATSMIFYNFDEISSYKILKDGKVIKEFKDALSSARGPIPGLLNMDKNK